MYTFSYEILDIIILAFSPGVLYSGHAIMICFITVTLKLRSKCSFNIKSSQTGRGHIPAEQYQMGKTNGKSR